MWAISSIIWSANQQDDRYAAARRLFYGGAMRIAIGSDHAGFEMKEALRRRLEERGHEVHDAGTYSAERVDYPPFGKQVARSVADGSADRGVLVCGSGIGMCIAANRFNGVRAAVLHDRYDAEMSRKHNDANIACLRGRASGIPEAAELLDLFLTTEFEGGRHAARVQQLDT